MKSFRLLGFECKKQLGNLTFLIILAVFTIFAVSQITEVFHMPVKSEQDIQTLDKSGERDYILVENSEADFILHSIRFLKQRIEDNSIPQNVASELDIVFEMLESGTYRFDDVLLMMQYNETVFPWLMACKSQFSHKLGSTQEVNSMMRSAFGDVGYSPNLYEKYVTYMQIMSVLIIFPLFLFLITRDFRHNMCEIVYSQPMPSNKYIILRYLGVLIPLAIYLYAFGLLLNLISAARWVTAGYTYQYTAFFPYFITYLLPTVFFFSSLIMALMLLFKKATAVFPIYIVLYLLTVTPRAFGITGNWIWIVNPIIRLDREVGSMEQIVINRIIYIVLGVIFIAISCGIYQRLSRDLRKRVTI